MSPILVPVLSNVLHVTGRIAESVALLDGAVEAARLSGNAQALGWNLLSRAFTALAAGDLETALDAAEESVDVTRGLDDSLVSTYASVALASALSRAGEPGARSRSCWPPRGARSCRASPAAGGPATSSC